MKLASVLGMVVMLLALAGPVAADPPVESALSVDLSKLAGRGFPPSMTVTVYRAKAASAKQPVVFFIPEFGSSIKDGWFIVQAQYFTDAGYVVAIPQLTDLYQTDRNIPAYHAVHAGLVHATTPYAVEVLAALIALTGPSGPATAEHVVLGAGYGAVVAANYAALGPPGCEGLIMISAGFGLKKNLKWDEDDMRESIDAFGQLGPKVKIPSLWLNAASNRRIPDQTANELFSAFHSGSPAATLRMLPDIDRDGDALFSSDGAPPTWQPETGKFLASVRKP